MVKAKIIPEHNVRKKQYAVTCVIDEVAEKVLEVHCHDCAASLGECLLRTYYYVMLGSIFI